MQVLEVRNVNVGLAAGLLLLGDEGIRGESRNGPVLYHESPVTTVYKHPRERVLFSPLRNANPFFHFMEAIWMLAGRDDARWPMLFNKRMGEYAEADGRYWGAYGFRWRQLFGYDQLAFIIGELQDNPDSRRCVLGMWSPQEDLTATDKKDLPCNTHIYFDTRGTRLNMTVCCRSNDIYWGCYGANAVHMSMLQEVMAAGVGIPVGTYRQVSNNFHLYPSVVPEHEMPKLYHDAIQHDYYTTEPDIVPLAMVNIPSALQWLRDAECFLHKPGCSNTKDEFFNRVADPMYLAWVNRNDFDNAMIYVSQIAAPDWRLACGKWLTRRKEKASK